MAVVVAVTITNQHSPLRPRQESSPEISRQCHHSLPRLSLCQPRLRQHQDGEAFQTAGSKLYLGWQPQFPLRQIVRPNHSYASDRDGMVLIWFHFFSFFQSLWVWLWFFFKKSKVKVTFACLTFTFLEIGTLRMNIDSCEWGEASLTGMSCFCVFLTVLVSHYHFFSFLSASFGSTEGFLLLVFTFSSVQFRKKLIPISCQLVRSPESFMYEA